MVYKQLVKGINSNRGDTIISMMVFLVELGTFLGLESSYPLTPSHFFIMDFRIPSVSWVFIYLFYIESKIIFLKAIFFLFYVCLFLVYFPIQKPLVQNCVIIPNSCLKFPCNLHVVCMQHVNNSSLKQLLKTIQGINLNNLIEQCFFLHLGLSLWSY